MQVNILFFQWNYCLNVTAIRLQREQSLEVKWPASIFMQVNMDATQQAWSHYDQVIMEEKDEENTLFCPLLTFHLVAYNYATRYVFDLGPHIKIV